MQNKLSPAHGFRLGLLVLAVVISVISASSIVATESDSEALDILKGPLSSKSLTNELGKLKLSPHSSFDKHLDLLANADKLSKPIKQLSNVIAPLLVKALEDLHVPLQVPLSDTISVGLFDSAAAAKKKKLAAKVTLGEEAEESSGEGDTPNKQQVVTARSLARSGQQQPDLGLLGLPFSFFDALLKQSQQQSAKAGTQQQQLKFPNPFWLFDSLSNKQGGSSVALQTGAPQRGTSTKGVVNSASFKSSQAQQQQQKQRQQAQRFEAAPKTTQAQQVQQVQQVHQAQAIDPKLLAIRLLDGSLGPQGQEFAFHLLDGALKMLDDKTPKGRLIETKLSQQQQDVYVQGEDE